MIYAKVIADSENDWSRIITVEFTIPTCVLQEFNTHKMLASNASSLRAIPFDTLVKQVVKDPFIPQFRKNQKGMQAGDFVDDIEEAHGSWMLAMHHAISSARALHEIGCHKQIVNRLLTPWLFSTVVATGEAWVWANFLALRTHALVAASDYAIERTAEAIRQAIKQSKPARKELGEWHLPYVEFEEFDTNTNRVIASVARCARISYYRTDKVEFEKDQELFYRLLGSNPKHASPAEHQAVSIGSHPGGKFQGWTQYRHQIEGERYIDLEEILNKEVTT
jgi:hypothetical protein